MELNFFVPGIPATAGSKTGFYNKKSGRVIMAPANKRQKPWMSHVQATALEYYDDSPVTDPIRMELVFCMPRPKSHFGTGKNQDVLKDTAPEYHTKKPDLTKLLRAVEDALTGIIWRDDSQVIINKCSKQYVDTTPGVQVRIKTIL